MKPMGVIGIIDHTIKLYRNNFKAIILFALLIGGTANLIISLMQMGSGIAVWGSPMISMLQEGGWEELGGAFFETMFESYYAAQPDNSWVAGLLSLAVAIFITPLVTGGVTFVALSAGHGVFGNEITEKSYLSQIFSKYGKLVGTILAVYVLLFLFAVVAVIILSMFIGIAAVSGSNLGIIVGLLLFFIILILAMALYVFAFPVAIQENRYGFAWLPRAWKLFTSRIWKTIGLGLLTLVLIFILLIILQIVFGMVFVLFPPIFIVVSSVLVTALLTPITMIAFALLYLDIRITTEGYDLEMRLVSMQNAEEGNIEGSVYDE